MLQFKQMEGTLDRIEGDYAIILIEKKYLPQAAKEGSALKLKIDLDEEKEFQKRKKAKKLISSILKR